MALDRKLCEKVAQLRSSPEASQRDFRQHRMRQVRAGNFELIAPDIFSDSWPKPIVANFIRQASLDMAESLAPLPTLTCSNGRMTSDAAKERSASRQRLGSWYWERSKLRKFSVTGADWFFTYGYTPIIVEPDVDRMEPRIRFEDPFGTYPEIDRYGQVRCYAKITRATRAQIATRFPELAPQLLFNKHGRDIGEGEVEIVRYMDKDRTIMWADCEGDQLLLSEAHAGLTRCPVAIADLTGTIDGQFRGQYDDAIWVQLARAKMASLALEAGVKAVEAPIAVPEDMIDLPLGPNAIWRSQTPDKIRRVPMEMPQSAFAMDQRLDMEQMRSTRYPEARSGNIQASVITGRGVQELMGSFDSLISSAQVQMGDALADATSIAFEMDEKFWGSTRREITGVSAGAPYRETITVSKVVNGDYSCETTYGMMAGLAPNNAVIMMLQLLGAGLISKESVQKQLPFDVDPAEMNRAIVVERGRDSIVEGIAALAQSIPAAAQAGQDPMMIVGQIATWLDAVQKGKSVEDAAKLAFTPPEPPPGMGPEGDAALEAEAAAAGLPPGMGPDGLMQGVAPGQAGMAPGGLPDVLSMVSAFRNGKPETSASIQTRRAI